MNLKNHDIGKILGVLVVAAGLREVFVLIFHLILREEYGLRIYVSPTTATGASSL